MARTITHDDDLRAYMDGNDPKIYGRIYVTVFCADDTDDCRHAHISADAAIRCAHAMRRRHPAKYHRYTFNAWR